jgi:hypothetical protein
MVDWDSLFLFQGSNGGTSTVDGGAANLPMLFGGSAVLASAGRKYGTTSALVDNASTPSFLYSDTPSDTFQFGASDYTLGMLFKISAGGTVILDTRNLPSDNDGYYIAINPDGTLTIWTRLASFGGTGFIFTSSIKFPFGKYAYLEMEQRAGVIRFSVNGKWDTASYTNTYNFNAPRGYTLFQPVERNGVGQRTAQIAMLRIKKGTAVHSADFLPPPDVLLHFNGVDGATSTVESSYNNLVVGQKGLAKLTSVDPLFGPTQARLPGNDNRFTIAAHPAFNLGTNDFTLDVCLTPNSLNGAPLLQAQDLSINANRSFGLQLFSTETRFYFTTDNVSDQTISFNTPLVVGLKNRLRFSRVDGVLYFHLGGQLKGSAPFTSNISASSADMCIGTFGKYAENGFGNLSYDGLMDELALWNGVGLSTASSYVLPEGEFSVDDDGGGAPVGSARLLATEANDSFVGSGRVISRGSGAFVESRDAVVITGSHEYFAEGDLAATEAPDVITGSGSTFFAERMRFTGTLPMLTLKVTGTVGAAFRGTLPMLALRATGGSNFRGRLPALKLSASAINPQSLSFTGSLPMLRLAGSIITPNVARFTGRLPMLSLRASGGAAFVGKLPALWASGTAYNESLASFTGRLPALTLRATGSTSQGVVFKGTLPMLVMGSSARATLVLPMLVMRGTISNGAAVAYQTFAINLRHKVDQAPQPVFVNEVTSYTGFGDARQIVRHGDKHFIVTGDAIYEHTGDTDDGQPIAWEMKTAFSDLGSRNLKQIRYMYIGGRLGGGFTGQIVPADDDQQDHANSNNRSQKPRNGRILGGRGTRSRYYGFGLANSTGERVDVDAIDIEYDVTGRGL